MRFVLWLTNSLNLRAASFTALQFYILFTHRCVRPLSATGMNDPSNKHLDPKEITNIPLVPFLL